MVDKGTPVRITRGVDQDGDFYVWEVLKSSVDGQYYYIIKDHNDKMFVKIVPSSDLKIKEQ